ncbi:hypothetical protein [Inquilinus limosus]|uniref:hypothetical protein n=1 Tax=Inquilinus limosus TaxID=171674 RepID=UPI00040F8C28|nr:hypothetical protein [Inquilinus limosus]
MHRQTRDNFDVEAVLKMIAAGRAPEQGWPSLVEEAAHLIDRLNDRLAAVRLAARKINAAAGE